MAEAAGRAHDHTLEDLKHDDCYDDHLIPLAALCLRYGTDLQQGLAGEEAQRRLRRDGPNALPSIRPTPWWRLLAKHLFGAFSGLLWAAAALCISCFLIEQHTDPHAPRDNLFLGVLILVIITITSLFGYLQVRQL